MYREAKSGCQYIQQNLRNIYCRSSFRFNIFEKKIVTGY